MIGDKLVITDYHRAAASAVFNKLKNLLKTAEKAIVVTVAGESGSGKSETAAVLAELCNEAGYKSLLLQQDDYFVYPPKTNHNKRLEDIGWVGPREVKLDLIEDNINSILKAEAGTINKPLIDYEKDLIMEETIGTDGIKVVVVEGTYTTLIKNADLRAFINRTYIQTKKARLKRSRDPMTSFLEQVLAIEHKIISAHKNSADIVIPPPDSEKEIG